MGQQDLLGLRALLARMVLQEALEPLEPQVTMELQEQLVLKEPQELQVLRALMVLQELLA
jgi:hypothetical protein